MTDMPGLIFCSVASAIGVLFCAFGTYVKRMLLVFLLASLSGSVALAADTANSTGTSEENIDAIVNSLDIMRKVLGGDDAMQGDWPSVVALVNPPGYFSLEDRFFCGGTLIAERWVLTAAHCLFGYDGKLEKASNVNIVAGIYDLADENTIEETTVTNIIVHPDYDNSLASPPHDIALLELASSVDVPVGQLFVEDTENYTGSLGFIVGWGATRYNEITGHASAYPSVLQEATVPLVSLKACNSPLSYGGLISVTQLCAGYAGGNIDTCTGDSGGPLFMLREDGQSVQVGITSFGNGCGQENFYGIYTNISHYIPWLANYVTVPAQPAELVAEREAGTNLPSDSGDGSGRLGSSGDRLLGLLIFLIFSVRSLQGKTGVRLC